MNDLAVINLFVILAIGGICIHVYIALSNIKKDLERLKVFTDKVGQEATRS